MKKNKNITTLDELLEKKYGKVGEEKRDKFEQEFEVFRLAYLAEEETLSPKEKVLNDIKEALQELKLIEQGKAKGRPVEELIDEL